MNTGEDKITARKDSFAMAFHCYQPFFNLDSQIEKACGTAYAPVLETLESYPDIKASFHFSGGLLEWMSEKRPDIVAAVRRLLDRGQIEIIGGACYEPVMSIIPERDRKEQIRMNESVVRGLFGVRPEGVWLAEKVWEPSLVNTLAPLGVKYTILDDYHLVAGDVAEENMFRPCRVFSGGDSLLLFPSLTRFRYSMPFRSPLETLEYMRGKKAGGGNRCFFFADDGEKFGMWPYTYAWVHRRGWLNRLFDLLLENSDWLETMTYSGVMRSVPPADIDNIPEASYAEMMEWSGGAFDNFLGRYSEAGRMHRRMLSVSDRIDAFENKDVTGAADPAKKELFRAQTNCPYWHGAFGGVYLPHLRQGVYRHLIKAENVLDDIQDKRGSGVRVSERAGSAAGAETVISNSRVKVFVDPASGGCVREIDDRRREVNLVNTLSRRKERYHDKLDRSSRGRIRRARKDAAMGLYPDIHDVLGVGERGLKRFLKYDDHGRDSFLTRIFSAEARLPSLEKAGNGAQTFLKGAYTSEVACEGRFVTCRMKRRDRVYVDTGVPVEIEVGKDITVGEGPGLRFFHTVRALSGEGTGITCAVTCVVEFNMLLWDPAVLSRPRHLWTDKFALRDRYSGARVEFFLDGKKEVYLSPVYSVNETESGLGKIFQGLSVLIGERYLLESGHPASGMGMTVIAG